jgi:hypothetical protein
MSGIITAPAFNNLFTATKRNSTMQGFVTAIYEIGIIPVFSPSYRFHSIYVQLFTCLLVA